MQREVAETSPGANSESLEEHPHVVQKLINLVKNEWQPTPPQYEELLTHLTGCIDCQIALGTLIAIEREYDRATSSPVGPAEQLLSRITKIIHETKARDEIRAYIELLEAKGEKKANKKFPQFVEHLKQCKACQLAVEETRDLLHRAKEAGLIDS